MPKSNKLSHFPIKIQNQVILFSNTFFSNISTYIYTQYPFDMGSATIGFGGPWRPPPILNPWLTPCLMIIVFERSKINVL